MELNTVCVAAPRAIDSLALGLKVCLQVSSKSGPLLEPTQLIKESFYNRWGNEMGWDGIPWAKTPPRLFRGCSENKLAFCARAIRAKRRLPRRVMRTEGQKGCHLSLTQRHLWPNRPLSVFLIYLIRWPVDIALSSFLCVCKLVGFNRFFFFSPRTQISSHRGAKHETLPLQILVPIAAAKNGDHNFLCERAR